MRTSQQKNALIKHKCERRITLENQKTFQAIKESLDNRFGFSRYHIYTWYKVQSLTASASYASCPTRIHKHCSTTTTYNMSHVHYCMTNVSDTNQVTMQSQKLKSSTKSAKLQSEEIDTVRRMRRRRRRRNHVDGVTQGTTHICCSSWIHQCISTSMTHEMVLHICFCF